MVSSSATSVEQYLAELPADRRSEVSSLRQLVLDHLPEGLEEVMNFGMIIYQVPASVVPVTYNGEPLVYAGIASQKNHISLYLMSIYAWEKTREEFESAWKQTGKKFNVGKSCIRFRSLSEVPLEVVTEAVAAISMEKYVARYQEVRASARKMKVAK
jgi:uncharacterized protein YdhG (YjbR/CyaY superfamily)